MKNRKQGNRIQWIVWFVASCTAMIGCKPPEAPSRNIHRAMYYWKSEFALTPIEHVALSKLDISTLYVKFFDVAWSSAEQKAKPIAILKIDSAEVPDLNIVPVVFLTEESILRTDERDIPKLGGNIVGLLIQLATNARLSPNEVQLDCDWTASTKDKYFTLLRVVKQTLPKGTTLSATIRLHQVKYRNQTGVPPVDKGMLMFYNMSNWRDPNTTNSIFDKDEAEKYTSFIPDYPMTLDLALPLFYWTIAYRNGKFLTIMNNVRLNELDSIKALAPEGRGNRFRVLYDTTLFGVNLRTGNMLRAEAPNLKEIQNAESSILNGIHERGERVALYHLDSTVLSEYYHDSTFSSLRPLLGLVP